MISSLLALTLLCACSVESNLINHYYSSSLKKLHEQPNGLKGGRVEDFYWKVAEKMKRKREATDPSQLAKGDRFVDFDWRLTKELNSVEKGNIVVSPISLKVVLAMLYEGAGGTTAQELAEALDLTNTTSTPQRLNTRERFSPILNSLKQTSKGKYDVKIGTHVFIDQKARPKELYKSKLREYYNSDMEKVDFGDSAAAVKVINNWASNVTEGHIQHLISEAEAHSNTIMLLLNAVYFKGQWEAPFPENQTKPGSFFLNNKRSVNVSLMNTTDRFGYFNMTELDAQMIRLPYMGDKFAMYIVLPNSKTGLNKLAETLGPNRTLTDYINNLSMASINLILPKFEFDFTISLRPTLEKLGIKNMFTSQANLTDIADTDGGGLVVSNVLQKAGISVTEAGTVAYAATVGDLMDKFGGDDEVFEFKVDHPFIFFIEDESVKTTVFVGKVTNPEKAKVVEQKIQTSVPETSPATTEPSECAGTICTNEPADRFQGDQESSQARYNYFDADLVKELGSVEKENFVVSPASIKSLLALIIEGADGTTLAELQTLLRLPDNMPQARKLLSALHNTLLKAGSSKVSVDSVAQAFISKTLTANMTYEKAIKDYYKAGVSLQDFSSPEVAVSNINSWINTRTGGLISTLVDTGIISQDTDAILTSAIYFNGKWKKEFLLKDTKELCFYPNPRMSCQMVPMMAKSEELYYKFDVSIDSHVLQIPYEDERFAMMIVLPRKKDGIKQLDFDSARLSFPGLTQKMMLYDVNLKMPRFTIEYGTELITILTKMGLEEVFTEKAQLPHMINGRMGRVSAMVHKAKIEVSEKGTKAAAASGAAVVPLMYGLDAINLELNHPFYYFITERESQTVLFAGRLSSVPGAAGTPAVGSEVALVSLGADKPSNQPTQNRPVYIPTAPPTLSSTRRRQTRF